MMKKLTPILQRPQDLILAITVDDTLPLTQILKTAHWQSESYRVEFSIIGESHRVRISHNSAFILEEMLACIDVAEADCTHYQALTELAPHSHQHERYQVDISVADTLNHWQPSDQEIVYTFPRINTIDPVTKIQWYTANHTLHWRTLHTYAQQESLIAIYTHSHYQLHPEE